MREKNDNMRLCSDAFTAPSTFKLRTGGKTGVSRQNLFQISCTATQILDLIDQTREAPILPQNVQIMGKKLGADGNLYVALPDNDERDITPQTSGVDYYDFNLDKQKFNLTIKANGNDLSATNPEFCVGQNVSFTLDGLPLASISNIVGNWTLSGNYVNEQWQEFSVDLDGFETYYGSINYRINDSLLANTYQTSCWFVNGKSGHAAVGLYPADEARLANDDFSTARVCGSLMGSLIRNGGVVKPWRQPAKNTPRHTPQAPA